MFNRRSALIGALAAVAAIAASAASAVTEWGRSLERAFSEPLFSFGRVKRGPAPLESLGNARRITRKRITAARSGDRFAKRKLKGVGR